MKVERKIRTTFKGIKVTLVVLVSSTHEGVHRTQTE